MTDVGEQLLAPILLNEKHECSTFNSGEPILDEWLRNRALPNIHSGASRAYVACPRSSRKVVGYYALCMGQILSQDVAGSMRRNMPKHIPAVILGRLAIDLAWQGKGLGGQLLSDAVHRSLKASGIVSARLVIVHALSPSAEAFYQHHGFVRLPIEAPTLALDLGKLVRLRSI
ncbi:MAG: GNAT family N-acetyltransferase [Alphaproteobacteria bacterium]|nr:GNAT family N-acetyltransferase [Alphaproteobacteria bacterium]